MKAGDTFLIPQPGTSLDSHLWVVISDPQQDAGRILIVNFTTLRDGSDRSCIVKRGEHHYIQHDTCVSYVGAKVVSAAKLDQLSAAKLLQNNVAVSPELLARIRLGAADSERMSMDHAELLIQQGLLDC